MYIKHNEEAIYQRVIINTGQVYDKPITIDGLDKMLRKVDLSALDHTSLRVHDHIMAA